MAIELSSYFGSHLLLYILILLVSSLPLYFAVKFLGGQVSLIEVMIVNVIAGGLPTLIALFFSDFIGLLSFLAIILVYMFFFKITFIRALIAWVLQYILIVLALVLFGGFVVTGLATLM